ncbi:hypothetical protein GF337_11370 [candidate division KSB1 bacterium]|nr:hypothetical protein [candidate division KSB1 bacterium]
MDPKNPDTGGRPTGIRIFSEFDDIHVTWNLIRLNDLAGYNVYRKTADDTIFSLYRRLEVDEREFIDYNVEYDTRYSYRITAVGVDFETPASDSVSIIPGPSVIWATDADNQRIIKISHDGIHTISNSTVLGFPWDIEITDRRENYWYSDIFYGSIYHIESSELTRYASVNYSDPVDIDFDSRRNILWGANRAGSILRISSVVVDTIQEIRDVFIVTPLSVAVSGLEGDCWVADPGSNRIYRLDASGESRTVIQDFFMNPKDIIYNENDHTLWVADSTRVVHLSFDGEYLTEINYPFRDANQLSVNKENGDLWVIDGGGLSAEPKILKFDAELTLAASTSGFSFPRNLVVNLADSGCVVADVGSGKIVRLTNEGKILGETEGYYFPYGLAIEYPRFF